MKKDNGYQAVEVDESAELKAHGVDVIDRLIAVVNKADGADLIETDESAELIAWLNDLKVPTTEMADVLVYRGEMTTNEAKGAIKDALMLAGGKA